MDWRRSETDWAQKYRPTKLEDVILPESIKNTLINIRDNQQGLSLLLYGPAGTGKTTTGSLINPDNTYKVNSSALNRIADVRKLIADCSSRSLLSYGMRVILMDEADYLTQEAQSGLRSAIEDLSHANMFVFTANYKDRLIRELHSRLHGVNFSSFNGDQSLKKQMVERVEAILELEGLQLEPEIIGAIVNSNFPDMRKILKKLQYEVGLA